jgi:hypothetical protein
VVHAHAQPSPVPLHPPAYGALDAPRSFELGGEVGVTQHSDEVSHLTVSSQVLSLRYQLSQRWVIGLEWGSVISDQSPRNGQAQWRFASGNALAKLTRVLLRTGSDRLQVYAALAHPLAWLPESVAARGLVRAGYAYAAASRGLWDAWLWAPEQLTAALGAAWVHDLGEFARVRLDGAFALATPLSGLTRRAADVYAQFAPGLEFHAARLAAGFALQSVLMSSSPDPVQLSLAPFGRIDMSTWQIELRGVLNIDEPLGFLGAGLGTWGWLLSGKGVL